MALFGNKKSYIQNTEYNMPLTRLLSYSIGNLQGIGARNRQEDSFAQVNALDVMKIKESGLLFMVCDGMGGMKDGKIASETAVATAKGWFESFDMTGNISQQLRTCALTASKNVERKLDGDGGSTMVMVYIKDEKFHYVSVGDSFLFLKRGGGLYRINSHHNLCNEQYLKQIRRGCTDPFPCREDKEAAALTSFLGMQGEILIDVNTHPIPLKDGDVLMACSDGVGGTLNEDEILGCLQLNKTSESCVELEKMILQKSKPHQDNYTAVVVRCSY